MIEHAGVTWLVNALWLVPLVAAATALAVRFGRLGPRGRHAAWMAALVLAVSLPALPATLLPVRLAPAARSWIGPPRTFESPTISSATGRPAEVTAPRADPLPGLVLDLAWTRAALLLAGLAVAITLCRLLVAMRAGRELVRAARPCDVDPTILRLLSQIAARRGRAMPPILESAPLASPAVVGVLRPAILIPPGFTHLCRDEQCAALLHELAHVVRRDYAWNLVCEAVSLPAAWHPAMFLIKAGVRRSRETVCDALAAEAMASRATYAKCLVSLAGRLRVAQASPAILVGLIGESDLEERLVTLLNPSPKRTTAALRLGGAVAIAATALAPALFLRVTPAFADEPVIARQLVLTAPATPVRTASRVAAIAPAGAAVAAVAPALAEAPEPAATAAEPAAPEEADADIQPPSPPEPPPPPPPPAPPSPPVTMSGEETRGLAAQGRYDEIVRRAVRQALNAEKAMESDEMRRALADLRASQGEIAQADRAKMHAEVAAAMAELDKVRAQLRSPEFRNAVADAARQAARVAAEIQADEAKPSDKD